MIPPCWDRATGAKIETVTFRRYFLIAFLVFTSFIGGVLRAETASPTTPAAKKKAVAKKSRRKPSHRRALRIHQAFVASTNLRSMAQQLLRDRSKPAYAGMEAYARKHAGEDAGALAWLVVGYAHTLDHDYANAIEPLRRAQARNEELADYVRYFLASSYQQSGSSEKAEQLLRDFDQKFPGSIFSRDARVTRANALLALNHAPDAVALLESDRQPVRADVELVLGRAYSATGQKTRAMGALRNVYYGMPMSNEADDAEKELLKLSGQIPAPTFGERRMRADLLARGKQYNDAVTEYRGLLAEAQGDDHAAVAVALGSALRHTRRSEAKQVLDSVSNATGATAAQRIFELGELARAADNDEEFLRTVAQLRQTAPASSYFEQALLSAANVYLLRREYDKATAFYHELSERFPTGNRAAYAHWKATWLLWRQGSGSEARRELENQTLYFPQSAEVPAALYWRARAAEEDGDPGLARAYYEKLAQRYRNYYYAELARQRLKGDVATAELKAAAPLEHLPDATEHDPFDYNAPPEDNLRVEKARLLANGAMLDLALRELQVAVSEEGGGWQVGEMARVCQDAGRYDRAIDVLKKAVPNYFSLDRPDLPMPYWQALFPRPYWADLKKFATENNLDPFLVAALIRQESAFNPAAVSHANAVGLMQVLPSTGRLLAREFKIRGFNAAMLTVPATNMRLGTRYFRGMIDKFGSVEYALAAYNAGSDRVEEWMGAAKYRDTAEFVESIPFTETREYVQAILRNAAVYKQLYGAP
jgi:soluble lytic murein transglycosylase